MDQVMRKHQGSITRLKSLKPKPDNNFNHQRKKTFLFQEEPFDQRFHTPYFGRKTTSVTKFYQGKPPPHSYSPELIDAPVPCFNRKATSVTDFFENFGRPQKKGTLPGGWFGRTATDVSEQQRIIPCPHYGRNTDGPTPYFGRLATFVTDPMRYPGDPTWRSILHHRAEDKRNPKYPGSADEYAVNPNHVSPRDLVAAAAKKRSQMVVGKTWMSSLDRDRIVKGRGAGNAPGVGTPPTPPYAVQTKTAAAHAAAKSASSDARSDDKPENGSHKSHGSGSPKAGAEDGSHRSHGNGSHKACEKAGGKPEAFHDNGSHKADSVAKSGGSHRSEPKIAGSHKSDGKCKDGRNCPPSLPPSGASCASDGAGSGDAAGCRSPRSELLSPRSDKSDRSGASRPGSPKSVLSSKSYASSGSGTSSHSGTPASGHTSSNQTSSKHSGQHKHQGDRGSNSSSSSTPETGDSKSKSKSSKSKSKSSKSKSKGSGRQMPSDPELMTCDELHDYNPDMCATFSAWGGRFKDKERNQPWPVPYEHPHERHASEDVHH